MIPAQFPVSVLTGLWRCSPRVAPVYSCSAPWPTPRTGRRTSHGKTVTKNNIMAKNNKSDRLIKLCKSCNFLWLPIWRQCPTVLHCWFSCKKYFQVFLNFLSVQLCCALVALSNKFKQWQQKNTNGTNGCIIINKDYSLHCVKGSKMMSKFLHPRKTRKQKTLAALTTSRVGLQ